MISGIIQGADLPAHFNTEKAQAACDLAFGEGVIVITGKFSGSFPNLVVELVAFEQVKAGSVTTEQVKAQIKNLACTAQETDSAKLIARQSEPTLLERLEQLEADVAALKGK